jgi:hypothetical protein
MKQLFVVFLILVSAAGAFAQEQTAAPASPLHLGLLADFRPSLLQYSGSANTADKYTTTGKFDFLTFPGNYNVWGPEENQLRLSLDYVHKTDIIKGHLRMALDALIKGTGGFVANDGKQNNRLISDVLNSTFDEWNIQGTLGPFGAFVGNTANRGVVKAWDGLDVLKFQQEQFGVVTPGGTKAPEIPWQIPVVVPFPTPAGNWQDGGKNPPENANFGKALQTSGNYSQEDIPYFMLTAKFAGFTVAAAGDLTPRSNTNNGSWYTALNGGVRISGEQIADLVTVDAVYKFRGGDQSTYNNVDASDPANTKQPDGKGKTTHSFTLSGQIGLLEENALGIQLAYTGLFRSYEDEEIAGTVVKKTGPFFSGIDLRFQYTGIERFQFNFNNNISFSSVSDTASGNALDTAVVMDFWDSPLPAASGDTACDWFALYNALGVQWFFTEKLNFWFEAGNKFSGLKTTIGPAIRNDAYDVLGASVKAVYTFSRNISVEAGLAFYYAVYTWTINDKQYDAIEEVRYDGAPPALLDTVTTNQFVFQVPLRVKFLFD